MVPHTHGSERCVHVALVPRESQSQLVHTLACSSRRMLPETFLALSIMPSMSTCCFFCCCCCRAPQLLLASEPPPPASRPAALSGVGAAAAATLALGAALPRGASEGGPSLSSSNPPVPPAPSCCRVASPSAAADDEESCCVMQQLLPPCGVDGFDTPLKLMMLGLMLEEGKPLESRAAMGETGPPPQPPPLAGLPRSFRFALVTTTVGCSFSEKKESGYDETNNAHISFFGAQQKKKKQSRRRWRPAVWCVWQTCVCACVLLLQIRTTGCARANRGTSA